ncbi:MAG TPA: aconitate hydratase AcnA [Myxococcales bacterium LLY-WYZ-16_1]|nr:aconitate hydratase AcnA [Myxococcales bacterium LLY-WYZ-16_1]
MAFQDPFSAAARLEPPFDDLAIYDLSALSRAGVGHVEELPYSIKVLLEAALRNLDGFTVTEAHVRTLAGYDAKEAGRAEIPFNPGRVVLQDFTGVPAVVDLAALRSAMDRLGGDVRKVNPMVPADLVIDHSVQVDAFGNEDALVQNSRLEFERNRERYEFLKWGQQSFDNFRVVPPATGIVHQVNLEYLASGVLTSERDGQRLAYPDSLVGTDSHTTMINGLGVLGWGVGGIEAEAVMLGQPIYMLLPEVVGFELTGQLSEGATATDLVLTVTQILRKKGVVGKFVEFFGPGLASMTVADRATIANMAPEYGATCGYFPVDDQTLTYLRQTGRREQQVALVEAYAKRNGFWREDGRNIRFTDRLSLDLGEVQPSLAGPKRPQDKVLLRDMKGDWQLHRKESYGHAEPTRAKVTLDGTEHELKDGAVVIAAITSCTNTSNPSVMVAAGLLARKAVERGLVRKPWVKTSLAPGSRVVTDYFAKSGLDEDLQALGFHTVGYGCTTCIGNSGPLIPEVSEAIRSTGLLAAAVLSGNRNFEGRVNPDVQPSYLASPPLVVAYALAGTVDVDLSSEPIGKDSNGRDVYLKELWPTPEEVHAVIDASTDREQYLKRYAEMKGPKEWQEVEITESDVYAWDPNSTYVQEPPFFQGMSEEPQPIASIEGAHLLVRVGDSVTTDHISPAGSIAEDSPAGRYLKSRGVARAMFNSYGSRRGNDRVMTRGTFANIRLRNELAPGTEGGFTTYFGPARDGLETGQVTTIFEASEAYQAEGTPLVVLAGQDYGMGSSRDWAAKGTLLLGVKAVIAESFERIHRSNLVGMGVLPLQFPQGETRDSLKLQGGDRLDVAVDEDVRPGQPIPVTVHRANGGSDTFTAICRLDTPVEIEYYRNGGILHTVLRRLAQG